MSSARISPRRATIVAEPLAEGSQGNMALFALRLVLMGCVFALVAVLAHVAWKIVAA